MKLWIVLLAIQIAAGAVTFMEKWEEEWDAWKSQHGKILSFFIESICVEIY